MKYDKLYQKDVVRTHSGIYFNVREPRPEDVYANDIAVGLSRECRFLGGAKRFYSVAEHSVWCAVKAEQLYPMLPGIAFKLLMHDAHEYIWKDVPPQIKHLFPEYNRYATLTQMAIDKRYGITYQDADVSIIAEIDRMGLEFDWDNKVEKFTGIYLQPEMAASLFLDHFKRLCPDGILTPKQTILS